MKSFWKFCLAAWFLGSLFVFSGCALFILGAGVASGYAVSKDAMEGILEKPFERIWQVSRDVIMKEGFIRREDRPHGEMVAEVRKSEVQISVKQLTRRTFRIRVKARKGYNLLPDPDLAGELYNQILLSVK